MSCNDARGTCPHDNQPDKCLRCDLTAALTRVAELEAERDEAQRSYGATVSRCDDPANCDAKENRRAATPVQGAPPEARTRHRVGYVSMGLGCFYCTAGPGEECRDEPDKRVAAPADGPTCAAWCGGTEWPGVVWFGSEVDMRGFCSPACRDAGSPLRPAPAVPEPVRELVPYPATPAAEEKKT